MCSDGEFIGGTEAREDFGSRRGSVRQGRRAGEAAKALSVGEIHHLALLVTVRPALQLMVVVP